MLLFLHPNCAFLCTMNSFDIDILCFSFYLFIFPYQPSSKWTFPICVTQDNEISCVCSMCPNIDLITLIYMYDGTSGHSYLTETSIIWGINWSFYVIIPNDFERTAYGARMTNYSCSIHEAINTTNRSREDAWKFTVSSILISFNSIKYKRMMCTWNMLCLAELGIKRRYFYWWR